MGFHNEIGPQFKFNQYDEARLNGTQGATHSPTEVERKVGDGMLRILGLSDFKAGVRRRRHEQFGIRKPSGSLVQNLLQLQHLAHTDGMEPDAPTLGMLSRQLARQFLSPTPSILAVRETTIDEQRRHRQQQQRVRDIQQPSDKKGHPFPHETSSRRFTPRGTSYIFCRCHRDRDHCGQLVHRRYESVRLDRSLCSALRHRRQPAQDGHREYLRWARHVPWK